MAAPRIDPKRLKPSRLWYWIAGAISLLSIVGAAVLFVSILLPLFGDVDPFRTPGSVTVDVESGDTRTIYQQVGVTEDFTIGTSDGVSPNDLACLVRGPKGQVEVSRANGFRYTRNNDEYEAKLKFTANASGEHVVTCRYVLAPTETVRLAVGPHFGTAGFVTRLVGFFAALFGGPVIGGLLALLVFLMRQRSKKRLQAQERASWPPPGGGAPPPPPPPPPSGGGAAPPPPPFMDAG